jgi:hypothetical protein
MIYSTVYLPRRSFLAVDQSLKSLQCLRCYLYPKFKIVINNGTSGAQSRGKGDMFKTVYCSIG